MSIEAARDIIAHAWRQRRPVLLDTSGQWHRCSRRTCEISHLEARVCLEGGHVIAGSTCAEHPDSDIVHVQDLYACTHVGAMHVCDRVTCTVDHGRCIISDLACAARSTGPPEPSTGHKRSRRRQQGVHTNDQGACILLYDLLFSARRHRYEVRRAEAALDVARRHSQRIVRTASRDGTQLRLQALVDVYCTSRQRMRRVPHLTAALSDEAKQSICRHYAGIFVQAWSVLASKLPCRCTFEGTTMAILYGMRRGVACDGIYAIPMDRFIAEALPDAHSITEVGISRRSLTQSKNALFEVLQQSVRDGSTRVEQFASIFSPAERPAALSQFD